MTLSWDANLRMAFEGSAALAGQGSIAQGETGASILISGVPLGLAGLLQPDEFIEAVAERGVRRLFLLCADGVTDNLERTRGPIYESDDFVLVAEPAGIWQLQQLRPPGHSRLIFGGAERPTTPQLDVAKATSRLEDLLLDCLDHPIPYWKQAVRHSLERLEGRSLPTSGSLQPFGVPAAAARLYYAALAISVSGMGGFDDMAPVSHFEVKYTVAQAVAASTRG